VRTRKVRALLVLAGSLVLLAVAFAAASSDRCGVWASAAPQVLGLGGSAGELKVGAAVVPIAVQLPATVAGYAPFRPTATTSHPLAARATTLDFGGGSFTLVTLDTLLVPARLQLAIAEGFTGRVWVSATHSHSSLGGYDRRPAVELGALGRFSPGDEGAIITAARTAVERSRVAPTPARVEIGRGTLDGLTVPRSGATVDDRLTVVRFVGERAIAQWVVASGHPTLNAPSAAVLDGDWPAQVSQQSERDDGPVTLVLQGAGGNATPDRSRAATAEAFATALLARLAATPLAVEAPTVRWSEVGFALPRPDASRLIGSWGVPVVENVLCEGSEHDAMVSVLQLGSLRLLFTTLEPSATAGAFLEEQAHVDRVVGLANGYHGYLELAQAVKDRSGEAKRQYFPDTLAKVVGEAATLAGQVTRR
jgi:hypothetical protein